MSRMSCAREDQSTTKMTDRGRIAAQPDGAERFQLFRVAVVATYQVEPDSELAQGSSFRLAPDHSTLICHTSRLRVSIRCSTPMDTVRLLVGFIFCVGIPYSCAISPLFYQNVPSIARLLSNNHVLLDHVRHKVMPQLRYLPVASADEPMKSNSTTSSTLPLMQATSTKPILVTTSTIPTTTTHDGYRAAPADIVFRKNPGCFFKLCGGFASLK